MNKEDLKQAIKDAIKGGISSEDIASIVTETVNKEKNEKNTLLNTARNAFRTFRGENDYLVTAINALVLEADKQNPTMSISELKEYSDYAERLINNAYDNYTLLESIGIKGLLADLLAE